MAGLTKSLDLFDGSKSVSKKLRGMQNKLDYLTGLESRLKEPSLSITRDCIHLPRPLGEDERSKVGSSSIYRIQTEPTNQLAYKPSATKSCNRHLYTD